ncbi:iron complex outermembrane recepter protein [Sphingobium sp. AP50]|uniref:TonB-dependent receptor n=1 Tax=Sphingobium sp. AP50 TaxID=1884369 RepID=UPI0008CBCD8E|nr:TonB-dependent receptor [Sphingobium sp. AP50]SEJ16546.1 iron complex outermembrane recepter protein [Sphingobium sp. AP50]
MKKFRRISALTASVAAVAFASPLWAQDNGPADTDKVGLADIVVTAQKRATNIQDTPIAMRAFDSDAVLNAGISDVNGLSRLAPDLNITNDTQYTKISVRGISSQDHGETADPALTINIDGEYINRPIALNASFFDLERIEVLRGPQGTLYGRNATAGALNIVVAKPKLGEFSGYATGSYGNYKSLSAEAAVNVPLGDKVAIRASGMHNEHDGYFNNGSAGRGSAGNTDAARLSIYAEPTEGVRAYLAGEYVNVDTTGVAQYGIVVANNGVLTNPAYAGGLVDPIPSTPQLENGGVPHNLQFNPPRKSFPLGDLGYTRIKQYAVRGRLDIDVGSIGTLSYIGGYRDVQSDVSQPLNGYVPTVFIQNYEKNSQTQSHEIRLSGGENGGVIYQVGAFYFNEDQYMAQGLFLPLAAGGSYLNYFYRPYVKNKSYAGFAQATVPLAETLSVTGGIRYTKDKKNAQFTNFGPRFGLGSTPPTLETAGSTTTYPNMKDSQVTWTLGVDYKPSRDNLIYGKVATGYKAGGFDNVSSFGAEKLTAYEIGTKNSFANRTIQFNASAFYYDYKDQQIPIFLDTNVGAEVVNAGASRIWGIETDTTILLSRNDRFTATVNYLNAKLTKFSANLLGLTGTLTDSDPNTPGLQPFDLSGNTPVQSPKWTIALGYDHDFHFGDQKVTASLFSRFKSDYYLQPSNDLATRQKAFTQTDFTLEWVAPNDRFSVQGFVRNIENYRPFAFAGYVNAGGSLLINYVYGSPRTYGVRGTVRF